MKAKNFSGFTGQVFAIDRQGANSNRNISDQKKGFHLAATRNFTDPALFFPIEE